MRVFKFGGASVKDAAGVRNVANIIQAENKLSGLVVVISAMGKMTNALEVLIKTAYKEQNQTFKEETEAQFAIIKEYHYNIINELFPTPYTPLEKDLEHWLTLLHHNVSHLNGQFDFDYDQIVSTGEFLSTLIVSHYLETLKTPVKWVDARQLIKTDDLYREGTVDWKQTEFAALSKLPQLIEAKKIAITQGFIGSDKNMNTVTLGREGSDYSAAIFAYFMNAENLSIWKDVAGVYNADPKVFPDAQKIDFLSYNEATELAYYGATIIHPKTIKPLQNKKIPLFVRSFVHPEAEGTVITADERRQSTIPSYIFKKNQILLSIYPKDFSFIGEHNLSQIFHLFAENAIHANLMQNSALSFSVCTDDFQEKTDRLIQLLSKEFKIRYNRNLELVTIRHYNAENLDNLIAGRKIYLEQKSRNTLQLVLG